MFTPKPYQHQTSSTVLNTLVSKKDTSLTFEVGTLESSPLNKFHARSQSLTQGFYEIVLIKKGSGKLRIDLHTQEIHDNIAVLLSPGQLYTFQPIGAIEGYRISFSQEFLLCTGSEASVPFHSAKPAGQNRFPSILLDQQMQKEVELIVVNMIRECSNYFRLKSEVLQGLLKILMIYLSRKIDVNPVVPSQSHTNDLITNFRLMVDKNYIAKKMVADYASDLFVTPNYLNEVVKKSTGFTASHHIQQRVILEAKRLAVNPKMSMKEIAFRLGYEDMGHFSKFFKKNNGISFTEFRNQINTLS